MPSANPNNLNQFRIKKDMRMAPVLRVSLASESIQALDQLMKSGEVAKKSSGGKLYIEELKTKARKPLNSSRTWPTGEKSTYLGQLKVGKS